jgi:hypothetical protein
MWIVTTVRVKLRVPQLPRRSDLEHDAHDAHTHHDLPIVSVARSRYRAKTKSAEARGKSACGALSRGRRLMLGIVKKKAAAANDIRLDSYSCTTVVCPPHAAAHCGTCAHGARRARRRAQMRGLIPHRTAACVSFGTIAGGLRKGVMGLCASTQEARRRGGRCQIEGGG